MSLMLTICVGDIENINTNSAYPSIKMCPVDIITEKCRIHEQIINNSEPLTLLFYCSCISMYLSILSEPDEGYYRNAPCALSLISYVFISTIELLSLDPI